VGPRRAGGAHAEHTENAGAGTYARYGARVGGSADAHVGAERFDGDGRQAGFVNVCPYLRFYLMAELDVGLIYSIFITHLYFGIFTVLDTAIYFPPSFLIYSVNFNCDLL
jgi:hypothetical protein